MSKFIIDGYNFLFCFPELYDDNRDALIESLNQSGHSMMVVFDAHNTDTPWSRSKKIGKLKIVFTQEYQSADDYIISFLRKGAAKLYQVVTEDRGLSLEVQSLGAQTISPASFHKKMEKQVQKRSNSLQKPSQYEVDRYLDKFTNKPKDTPKPFKGFSDPELDRLWNIFNHLPGDEPKG